MIKIVDNVYILETNTTTYLFQVLPSGHLEHLYYGKKLYLGESITNTALVLSEKHSFTPSNTLAYQADSKFSLEDMRLEMSSYGKGDIREPFVEIVHSDGSPTNDFIFDSAEIVSGTVSMSSLPSAYEDADAGQADTLIVHLNDSSYGISLDLYYSVFADRDLISRRAVLLNRSGASVKVERLMSMQLDLDPCYNGWVFTTFNGAWAREMSRVDHLVTSGKITNSTIAGVSSNRANPFVMLSHPTTTEDYGECMGFNLIYSGNHYECVETSSFGKIRLVTGINPSGFSWILGPGESFEAPEAVITFSSHGFNGMSRNMHDFVNHCVVRGKWKMKERPILLNSWEAAYFNINESKLMRLAREAKKVGVELFVMDDGWFGKRNDDTSSLGDWFVNPKKLPHGIAGLCDKVNALGMDFGIWVEPEMVNVDSKLYQAHPDWALQIPEHDHTEGRHQRILDLCNPKVVDYLYESMAGVFASANIAYVKWDMNRIFSDAYSPYLDSENQGEVYHRYVLGLYNLMGRLVQAFPSILFEGCASGGCRFDLGILSYFPQIWASDNTDACYRVHGQTGYSYGYPSSCVSAHVSACPNHQTLRTTPLQTRFAVAAFGVLGYECNLCDMSKEELSEIAEQIKIYKEWRSVVQYGKFYRGRGTSSANGIVGSSSVGGAFGGVHEWTCTSGDGSRAVGMIMQELVEPNHTFEQYFPKGLISDTIYHFTNREIRYNIKNFGDLVNTQTPVHVKQGSMIHNILAKYVTMPGETEDYTASGDVLMAGVKLAPAFSGNGYDESVRYYQDFAARVYFMEKI